MQTKSFTVKQVDVRIIDSKIGRVIPVEDIADAVGCNKHILLDIIRLNIELFESWVISIKLSKSNKAEPIKALNYYGVISILAEYICYYVNDEESSQTMFRLKEWFRRELLSPKTAPLSFKKKHSELLYSADGVEFIKPEEAIKIMGRSYRSVLRYAKAGKINTHKVNNGYLFEKDDVIRFKQKMDNWKKSISDRKTH